MHFVQLNTAATLAFDLPLRCDSGATYEIKTPSGGVVESGTVVRNSVDTTLSAAIAAGAVGCTVTSATNIRIGGHYIIGSAGSGTATREDIGGEEITVKSISGTTVTFTTPVVYSHASGHLFQSRGVSVAVSATTPTTVGRHWRVEVTYSADDGSGATTVAQPLHVVSFDVVRFVPVTQCTWNDVIALDPVGNKRRPAGLWWPSLRDSTWDMILRRLGAKLDTVGPGALVGVVNLTTAHAYLARAVLAETGGQDPEQIAYRELMAQRFTEEFDAATAVTPVDNDGDGAVEENEGFSLNTIDLRRG